MSEEWERLDARVDAEQETKRQAAEAGEEAKPKIEAHLKEIVVPALAEIKRELEARGFMVEVGVGQDEDMGWGRVLVTSAEGQPSYRFLYTVDVAASGVVYRHTGRKEWRGHHAGRAFSAKNSDHIVHDFINEFLSHRGG
jgi:hypothetical protein